MVRKLAMAVSLAMGSTLSFSVYALGLGEIRTNSALNENFKGEIELLSVQKGQLDTLKVGLAPAEVFARTGVERPFLLSQLRFKAVRKRDGHAVILVTSKVPIREPFLDFFVQVTWPQGKLVKEYTVLLDPPVTTHRAAPRVKRASGGSAATTAGARPAHRAAPEVQPGGEYGPVRANETLWQIAERIRPRGISVHQMMVALYRANPDAFLRGDINLLKKGRILKVPELDRIEALNRRQAFAEFQRLATAGAAPTGNPSAAAQGQASVSGSAAKEAQPATGGGTESAAVAQSEGQLRIAGVEASAKGEPGTAENEGEGGENVQALKQKLLLVEEQAATARQEADELKERMAAMEKQLADMKRLLTLRNQELAQLQAQAAMGGGVPQSEQVQAETLPQEQPEEAAAEETSEEPGATAEAVAAGGAAATAEEATTPEPATEASVEEATEATSGVTQNQSTASPAEAEQQPMAAAPESTTQAAQEAPAAGEGEQSETTVAGAAAQPEKAAEKSEPAPVKAKSEKEQVVPAWKRWLTDNWQIAAGGGAAVLLLLGLVATRRKKASEDQPLPASATVAQPAEKEPQPGQATSESQETEAALAGVADSAIGDTSFLSEYSTEELRALHEDTTEVDPVAEADVYIAYGRYSQAEEILREAMKNGDNSAAVRHKMLEVYYATQKKDEFRELAEQMVADGQDKEDPQAWEHIQTMGRDLDRSNPLFAAAAAAGGVAAAAGPEEQDSDLSLDLSTLAEEVDSQLNPDSESLEAFSNLDLELPSLQIEPEEQRESDQGSLERADDLSLSLNETELHTELADLSDLGDLDVDATTLDETLADLTGDLEGVMADSHVLDQPVDLEQSALSELESLTVTEPVESAMEQKEAGEDSTIGDEVETKLELAKAFLDIGDADGARSILQEVEADGTPEQKQAAAELLAQLDG